MKLFSPSIALFIAITVFAPFASGQTLYWVGGMNGDFNTALNWSTTEPILTNAQGTGPVPGLGDTAVVYPNIAETNNGSSTVGTITITAEVNNTIAGLQINNNLFFFDLTTGSNGTVILTNTATLAVQGVADVGGHGETVEGDVDVDGGTSLSLNGTGAFQLASGRMVVGDDFNDDFFGNSGTLNISAGTLSTVPTAGNKTEVDLGSGEGATGTLVQSGNSVVVTGNWFYVGVGGGTGIYKLTSGSLNTGVAGSVIAIGVNSQTALTNEFSGTNSVGDLNITGTASSAVNIGNAGTADLQVGTLALNPDATFGGTGTITQNDANSQVNIIGASTMEIGDSTAAGLNATAGGTVGQYNLEAGRLNIGTSATDTATVILGDGAFSTGTLNQTGGTLTALADTTFLLGSDGGTGIYNMSGGTATFENGLTIGANGTINLNGGTISSPIDSLNSTGGRLNLGGGDLYLTGASATPTYTYNFAGSLTQGTSIIDVSTVTGLTTFTFNNPLSGAGGISLVGNGTTVFNFASNAGGAADANTYTGSTGISGGTLNALGEDLTSAAAGTVLSFGSTGAAGTLNLTLDSSVSPTTTLNQAITGTGQLNVIYSATGETLYLANTSSTLSSVGIALGATGGNAGTLQVLNGAFGTITDNGTGSSVIVGTGTGTGTVTFGTTSYTGQTMIDPNYTLSATNLQGNVINNGTLSVTTNIGHAGGANTVANTGSLSAGTIVGDVTSNSGTISITGAGITGNVISNSGSLSAANVSGAVTSTGTFVGTSALGATTVGGNLSSTGANAVLASATPLPTVAGNQATFTIGGNLTESGTLNIRTNGIAADEYVIGGTASVGGNVHLTGFGTNSTGYTVVSSTGALTDNGLAISSTTLFSGTLTQVGNTLVLTTKQIPSASFAQTPAQANVAMAIDKFLINPQSLSGYSLSVQNQFLAFNSIYSNLTPGEFASVQEQLTPITLQYARDIAFENTTYLAERMNGVDANLRSGYEGLDTSAVSIVSPGFGSGLGRSLGSLLASDDPGFHSSAPNGVNYYPGESGRSSPSPSASEPAEAPAFDSSTQVMSDTPNPYLADVHPGGPDTPKLSEFIGGDVVLADLNKDGSLANAPTSSGNYTAGGATAGVSFRVTNHFAAGVLFDYNHTDADTDSNGSKIKVDSYSPGIFATYFDKGFYANGLFSFGYNNYSDTRAIPAFGTTASSSPSGEQYVGDLDVGYDFHPDKAWVVGPTLGATYTHLDIDSAQESGAGFEDLSINSQSLDSLRSRLGAHVLYQTYTGDVLLQPSFTAMWQHEFLASAADLTSNFTELGGASTFTTPTASPVRNSALIGLGLTATLSNSMALYISYLADVGDSDFFSQSVIGGLKARF